MRVFTVSVLIGILGLASSQARAGCVLPLQDETDGNRANCACVDKSLAQASSFLDCQGYCASHSGVDRDWPANGSAPAGSFPKDSASCLKRGGQTTNASGKVLTAAEIAAASAPRHEPSRAERKTQEEDLRIWRENCKKGETGPFRVALCMDIKNQCRAEKADISCVATRRTALLVQCRDHFAGVNLRCADEVAAQASSPPPGQATDRIDLERTDETRGAGSTGTAQVGL
jgi:hypothetical protein